MMLRIYWRGSWLKDILREIEVDDIVGCRLYGGREEISAFVICGLVLN